MIPRRMLGFGFALFLMLVILAVIYTQFNMRRQANPSEMNQMTRSSDERMKSSTSSSTAMPLPATVTPDTAENDLIDEALTDRDDLSASAEDEKAGLEEGN